MTVNFPEGKYILAVSGGVDSVTLLHMLAGQPGVEVVVAHFDHGIRPDSAHDADFVAGLAAGYGLPYVTERAELGMGVSEAAARTARYAFLRRVLTEQKALAVLTAHHQDDLLETMLMHVLRGTGRRGLSPMRSQPDIVRPLINLPKKDILDYAAKHSLAWREDSTNADPQYLRNAVRLTIMPKLGLAREQLLALNQTSALRNDEIDDLLPAVLSYITDEQGGIIRNRFVGIPYAVARECMHYYLTQQGLQDITDSMVQTAVLAVKTLQIGKKINCGKFFWLKSDKKSLKISKTTG